MLFLVDADAIQLIRRWRLMRIVSGKHLAHFCGSLPTSHVIDKKDDKSAPFYSRNTDRRIERVSELLMWWALRWFDSRIGRNGRSRHTADTWRV